MGRALDELEADEAIAIFNALDRRLAAVLLGEVSDDLLIEILSRSSMPVLVQVLGKVQVQENEKVSSHIAEVLPELDTSRQVPVFLGLPRDASAEVFSLLDTTARDTLILSLTDRETKQVLAELRPDDRTDLFEELPGQVTQRLLNLLSPQAWRKPARCWDTPVKSVGRLMTPQYVAVRPTGRCPGHWTTSAPRQPHETSDRRGLCDGQTMGDCWTRWT